MTLILINAQLISIPYYLKMFNCLILMKAFYYTALIHTLKQQRAYCKAYTIRVSILIHVTCLSIN